MGVAVILLSSSSSMPQQRHALASRLLALGLLAAPFLRTRLRILAATPTPSPPQPAAGLPASGKLEAGPNPGKPGFGWGGECTDYAATDLRRAERPRPPFWP